MIFTAFRLLRDQLDAYIQSFNPMGNDPEGHVVLDNVATLETPDRPPGAEEKIILSMVNIEEEATLKNTTHYVRNVQGIVYQHPPIYLNLYMLVSAHYTNYEHSLTRLSQVIQFFQGKNVFTMKNSPDLPLQNTPDVSELRLNLELFSLSFEQLNHLWGALGGKQMPSALYKIRLVKITENRTIGLGTVIEEIQSKDSIYFP
ncbi:DUF4255 domain-containing protein [Chitinophaga nivalis]|uniref:DUF4255 domain-containing protein n=1 Tax=Chitinophaga nivalis TaxID=2991709 RepID=A0ABT3IP50_9BACT|nr:DUF4255 domain-containing protein [Chitinophaga nivalis]MCW3464560.1 DUF4255 domain-containing protein [Chitinophaga nivalis]MCW3485749.1 DUF4255 domain-containing protein [Chitinophaga nivalis]